MYLNKLFVACKKAKVSPDNLKRPQAFCSDLCLIVWNLKWTITGNGVSTWVFPSEIPVFRKGGQMVT